MGVKIDGVYYPAPKIRRNKLDNKIKEIYQNDEPIPEEV